MDFLLNVANRPAIERALRGDKPNRIYPAEIVAMRIIDELLVVRLDKKLHRLSYHAIAEELEVAPHIARRALEMLVKAGVLTLVKKGEKKRKNGVTVMTAPAYRFNSAFKLVIRIKNPGDAVTAITQILGDEKLAEFAFKMTKAMLRRTQKRASSAEVLEAFYYLHFGMVRAEMRAGTYSRQLIPGGTPTDYEKLLRENLEVAEQSHFARSRKEQDDD